MGAFGTAGVPMGGMFGSAANPFGTALRVTPASDAFGTDKTVAAGATLLAHWKLDEATGTSAADSAGSYTGTLTGGVDFGTDAIVGKIGGALTLNGTSDYISCGTSVLDIVAADEFTISFWIKTTTTAGVIIGRYQAGLADGWTIGLQGTGEVHFWSQDSGGTVDASAVSTATVDDGNWHLVSIMSDGSGTSDGIGIYVDGVEGSTNDASAFGTWADVDFRIGNRAGTDSFWGGSIDDVRLYDGCLVAGDILALYDAGFADTTLIHRWKLDEASGTIAEDSGYTPAVGTLTGGIDFGTDSVVGRDGGALTFNGSTDYIDCGAPSSANWGSGDGTVSAWFRTTATGSNTLLINGAGGTGNKRYQLYFETTDDKISFQIDDNATLKKVASTDDMNDGNWHHVVAMRNGNNLEMYVDGVAETPTDITGYGDIDDTEGVQIGASWSGGLTSYFNGDLDDVRIYNTALSAAQVTALYDSYHDDTSLIHHWKLNELSGTVAEDHGYTPAAGTVSGATVAQVGRDGLCYDFDGTGDYVGGFGNNIGLERTDSFTLAAWVNCTSTGTFEVIFGKRENSSPNVGWELGKNTDDTLRLDLCNNSTNNRLQVSSTNVINGSVWRHVVATYDGTSDSDGVNLYIDGVLETPSVDQNTLSSSIATSNSFFIGTRDATSDGSREWTGLLDDLRIYNRELSAAEITTLYDSYSPSTTPLVGSGSNYIDTGSTLGDFGSHIDSQDYSVALCFKYSDATVALAAMLGVASVSGPTEDLFHVAVNRSTAGQIESFTFSHGTTRHWYDEDTGGWNNDEWHTLVVSKGSSHAVSRIYVDGVKLNTTQQDWDSTLDIQDFTRNLYLFARNEGGTAGTFYTGSLSDVRLFKRALSPAEALAYHNGEAITGCYAATDATATITLATDYLP